MGTARKVTLGALLVVAAAILVVAVVQLWSYRQWDYLPLHGPYTSDLDRRSSILQDRVEILTKRVGDMELLVLILLGTSGLYAIVFVASSYFSAATFARQAERSIASIKDQLGLAMGDLRELKEEAQRGLRAESAQNTQAFDKMREETQALIRKELDRATSAQSNLEARITATAGRIARWKAGRLDEQEKLELLHAEAAVAAAELTGRSSLGPKLGDVYRSFARLYGPTDGPRARFYLRRALSLTPEGSPQVALLHYDLACSLAASRQFEPAMQELLEAFEHRSKTLDDRLTADIEEGGVLYQLAVTPPFNAAVDELLLNMSIGIG